MSGEGHTPSKISENLEIEENSELKSIEEETEEVVPGSSCNSVEKIPNIKGKPKKEPVTKETLAIVKAGEAAVRVTTLRKDLNRRYEAGLASILNKQTSALRAIRLEWFMPLESKATNSTDPLGAAERSRVEKIIDDEEGLCVMRKLN